VTQLQENLQLLLSTANPDYTDIQSA
jgi:hypothetical protein